MATYQNRTGNRIELGIGTRPGVPWTRYDSEHGEVVEGPGVPNYREVFECAGYTLVTEEEAIQFRVSILLDEAKAKEEAEAAAKAEAEAKAKAEEEAAQEKANEELEPKVTIDRIEIAPDPPAAKPTEREQRGSNRRAKG